MARFAPDIFAVVRMAPRISAPLATPVTAPAPVAAPVVAAAAPSPQPVPNYGRPSAPQLESASLSSGYRPVDIQIADVDFAEVSAEQAAYEDALAPMPVSSKPSALAPVAMASASVREAQAPKPSFSPESTRLTQSARSIRSEAQRTGKASRSVVQVGAYMKRGRLNAGWDFAMANHGQLSAYAPMAARTVVDGQTFYRLAAHGFASDAEARRFCDDLKAAGGQCWVRRMEGDAPFRMASKD